ncbi:M10 family metallopeptidase C-terminal domain-containing protein [Microvirga sp. M2]|uniref:M10 family metallopeptidase C-terminal domain-containing protein n=1 Tax=Microvirga sp. M2 TaxID=3073270 RepID=UPI0039C46BA8
MADPIVLTIAEALVRIDHQAPIIVSDQGINFQNLTTKDIGTLAANGAISFSAWSPFNWNWEKAAALLQTNISFNPNGGGGTLSETAAFISGMSVGQIIMLGSRGFKSLDAGSTGTIVFSVEQLRASANLNVIHQGITSGNTVALLDTRDNLGLLTPAEFAALKSQCVKLIDVKDGEIGISFSRLRQLDPSIKFATDDKVSATGSSTELADLSDVQFAALRAQGVDFLDASNPVTLSHHQAWSLTQFGLPYVADDKVTVLGAIGDFTAAELAALGAKGADVLDADQDNDLDATVLTSAKAAAVAGTRMVFAADDTVTIADSGANLARLTAAQFAKLAAGGVDMLDSTTNSIALTSAQYAALGSIRFAAGDHVTIGWTGSAGANSVAGSRYDDTMKGLAGNDTLKGGSGNDTIYGGSGNDTLYGGSGQDVFVFDKAPSTQSNKDRIADWNRTDDTIQLENGVFTALKKTGALASGFFRLGAAAKDGDDHIGYNKATGDLWYDSNGSKAGGQVVFANIGKDKPITHNDFIVT